MDTMSNDDAVTPAPATRTSAREINDSIRYTAYAVYSRSGELDTPDDKATAELTELVAELAEQDVLIRGFYDVSALRADADLMVWWHAPTAEALQPAARGLRRTAVGRSLSRPGRPWACTARPSSTRATCRRSWPARRRRSGPPSTRSSGPTSGTCCRTRNAAACWSSTE